MMENNATETISIRKKVYVLLKEGKTIEEINATKYTHYKKHADFFGVFDNKSGIILDEISNQSYTEYQLLYDGLYDIIATALFPLNCS